MKFVLSEHVQRCVETQSGISCTQISRTPLEALCGKNINHNRSIYQVYPRNVYLRTGRMNNMDVVWKTIKEFTTQKQDNIVSKFVKKIFLLLH